LINPVYIHCHAGIGRSSSLLIAYLFLFKYPDKKFDDVVDMVRAKTSAEEHFISPHVELAKSLEELREISSISFAGEKFREGTIYNAEIGKRLLIQADVKYAGDQRPYGVYVRTNLNEDGKEGEDILMKYNSASKLYEAWITPQRTGNHFWLSLYALPHRNDHPFKRGEDIRRWVGEGIYFQTKSSSSGSPFIPKVGETDIVNFLWDIAPFRYTMRDGREIGRSGSGLISILKSRSKFPAESLAQHIGRGDFIKHVSAQIRSISSLQPVYMKLQEIAQTDESPQAKDARATEYLESFVSSVAPGGIDLNPTMLNLQTRRDGNGVAFQAAADGTMQVNGFTPVIIRITPMVSPLFSDPG
jgi:hypothetical protein